MQTQSITGHYGQDHQRLDELFHRFRELRETDFRAASRLFAEFKAGLNRHIIWEEEILFPLFDTKIGHLPGSPTEVMRWEHQHLRRYLARIEQSLDQANSEADLEQIAFLSLLCSHNQKEEGILYPMIDKMLGDLERREIFAEMEKTN